MSSDAHPGDETAKMSPGKEARQRKQAKKHEKSRKRRDARNATKSATDSEDSDCPETSKAPEVREVANTNTTDGKYRHFEAIHSTSRASCLSHDAEVTPSFIGFRNLVIICLLVGNLRLMIENWQKYGVLVCVRCHNFGRDDLYLALKLYFLIPCHLLVAFAIEAVASKQAVGSRKKSDGNKDGQPTREEAAKFRRTWATIRWTHALNVVGALGYTSYYVYYHIHHPLIGTFTELHAIIVLLKTCSYAFTNRDLRHAFLHPSNDELGAPPKLYSKCAYPNNITIGNLCYFWWAPTLVYQPVYPRTPHIRWMFVLKRLTETLCLTVFIWFMSAQYASPLLKNSMDKIHSADLASIIERVLKLSTVSLIIWLAGFFAFFQSALNALAEITRFGDRSFYDDWWNSVSVGRYWQTWNKPVYKFFRRHVYSPMIGRGYSSSMAAAVVFFVSAVLHELLVGIPTHNIIGVAFGGMIVQLVLSKLTKPFEKSDLTASRVTGNSIFWVLFTILGQPTAALSYYYFWQYKYGSVSKKLEGSASS